VVLKQDFRTSHGYWVHMTAHRFECAMNAELAGEGITYRQCQVLAWLSLEGDLSQIELARLMHVQPSTLVPVLDRMVRDGLIARKPATDDRRKRIITPTRKALPVWKRIIKCVQHVRARSREGLSDEELAQLRSLLMRIHDNLSEPADTTRVQSKNGRPAGSKRRATPRPTIRP
jgi:MarR family transcriptional regulator for hemolysin